MYKVTLDGEYVYHPWDPRLSILSGTLTQELNKNGTFDFAIGVGHPLFNEVSRRKSIVEVFRFTTSRTQETVYRGCCINDQDSSKLAREIQTDGELVFLKDSVIRPINGIVKHTPAERFRWLVNQHNDGVDGFKRFIIGAVDVTGESKAWERGGYSDTRSEIDALVNDCGGYVRTRNVGDLHFIDYVSDYNASTSQEVRQGVNIIDITRHVKTDDLATRIIPVYTGTDPPTTIKSVNNGLDYVQDDAAVSEFGIITKTAEFADENLAAPGKLMEAGKKHLESTKGVSVTIELTAVDLADAGLDIDAISVGDMVQCAAPTFGIRTQMLVSKKVTDILKPSNSKITLGSTLKSFTQIQLKKAAQMKAKSSDIYGIPNTEIDGICK